MAQRTVAAEASPPILIDLGKVKGKDVRQFKDGCGPLAAEVQKILAETRNNLGAEAATKELVPIVLVYKKKRRRKGGGRMLKMFPF